MLLGHAPDVHPSRYSSLPFPEVTVVICRVPLPGISHTPSYFQLTHLCRFTVRALMLHRLAAFLVSMDSTELPRQLSD